MAFSFKNVFSSLKDSAVTPPQKVVGIDFGSASVKVVEVEQREKTLALSSYGELQLGPYAEEALGKPVQLEQPKRIEALVDVLRESKIHAKDGVIALPLASSFVTIMSMPAQANEDISPRVRVEARKYIPVPITDVTLDWTELRALGDAKTNIREVLVAAIQNDSLQSINDLMRAVQMASQPAEIELFGAIRSITKDTDEAIVIIDFGARTSKMYIAHDGLLRRLHRVHIGGVHATEKLAHMKQLEFGFAENLKRNYDPHAAEAKDIKSAVVTSFERPIQEFRRVLEQFEARNGAPVSRIVLTGGSAAFPEMSQFVSYMFDREVVRANPFTKVAYPAFMEDTLTDIAPTFAVALGCALRPFE